MYLQVTDILIDSRRGEIEGLETEKKFMAHKDALEYELQLLEARV